MKRLVLATAVFGVLLTIIATTLEVRSDASDFLGPITKDSLDSLAGREMILALEASDVAKRNKAAREIAGMLAKEPLVAQVLTGPRASSNAFLDWVWQRRFWFSPPSPEDLTVDRLSQRLADARKALSKSGGMVLGDRMLRDPTGSFANLLDRVRSIGGSLGQTDGIWQTTDGTAAIIFMTLADRKFEAAPTAELAERIRARAAQRGVSSFLLGPRIIAADINADITRSAGFAALVAGGLLFGWLAWSLHSARRLWSTLVPLALGIAIAALSIQLAFGSVHIIALGFGGALIGLALDYPLHLMVHRGIRRRYTERLIMIGASTTAAGFLALLGSGTEVLMQTGLFVAVGIAVAAAASPRIIVPTDAVMRSPPLERLAWRLPHKPWIEAVIIIAGVAIAATAPGQSPQLLFAPSGHVEALLAKFAQFLPLPSGQYLLTVQGKSLNELLEREAAIQPVLKEAIKEERLERFAMMAQWIAPASPTPFSDLPSPEEYRRRVSVALRANGMAPSFAEVQAADYATALKSPNITFADLERFAELQRLKDRLAETSSGWRERITLFGVHDPKGLATAIASANVPGVSWVDIRQSIESRLTELRHRVTIWLGIGALVAFAVLALGLGDWRKSLAIARTTTAAVSLAAAVLALTGGTVGIFQIVALTLVVGIGIDYGLFLSTADRRHDPEGYRDRCRSVALCAGTTLIAFAVMGFASIRMLQEIGLTISLGVTFVLALNLAQSRRIRSDV